MFKIHLVAFGVQVNMQSLHHAIERIKQEYSDDEAVILENDIPVIHHDPDSDRRWKVL